MRIAGHADAGRTSNALNHREGACHVPTVPHKLLLASIVVAITALSGIVSSSGLVFPPESTVAPPLSSAAFPAQGRSG